MKEHPEKLFFILKNTGGKKNGYKELERKYNIQFKPDFYKFIDLQEKFIPILCSWVKNVRTITSMFEWFNIVWPIDYSKDVENIWISGWEDDDEGMKVMGIATKEPQYDDTWIMYSPVNGKYGFDFWANNLKFDTLKEAVLDCVEAEIKYYERYAKTENDRDLLDLSKLYRDFLKRN